MRERKRQRQRERERERETERRVDGRRIKHCHRFHNGVES